MVQQSVSKNEVVVHALSFRLRLRLALHTTTVTTTIGGGCTPGSLFVGQSCGCCRVIGIGVNSNVIVTVHHLIGQHLSASIAPCDKKLVVGNHNY
jgi:hypothetical protein